MGERTEIPRSRIDLEELLIRVQQRREGVLHEVEDLLWEALHVPKHCWLPEPSDA